MKTTKKIKEVFGLDDLFDVMCFIYDNQMDSGGGIMKGFKGYLTFDTSVGAFKISDGWDTIDTIDTVRNKNSHDFHDFSFYAVPFAEALQEAIEKFIDLCYTGGEVGPNPVKH